MRYYVVCRIVAHVLFVFIVEMVEFFFRFDSAILFHTECLFRLLSCKSSSLLVVKA